MARPERAVFLISTDDFVRKKWIDRATLIVTGGHMDLEEAYAAVRRSFRLDR